MTSTHVRPSGTAVLRSRTARALVALAFAVALIPATPTPARAAVFSCPAGQYVVEGTLFYDLTTIADDQDARDAFYAYILDDWYSGDEAALQSGLGSTPEAREAKLTEWLIAEFSSPLGDDIFFGGGGGRVGSVAGRPMQTLSETQLIIGGRHYTVAEYRTCSPTLVPALTTPIARLGTFEVVTDFTEPDVTCEATVFSPYAHFDVNEIPFGAVPTRNYRTADGTFVAASPTGPEAVVARDLARASAAAGAGSCTIGASSGPTDDGDDENGQSSARVSPMAQSWIATAGAAPQLNPGAAAMQMADGTQIPLTMSSPAPGQVRYAADGVTVTLTGASGTSATNGLVAAPTGEIACEVCVTAVSGEVIEVWMFSTPRLVAAHLVDDAECQVFAIPLGAPLDGAGPVPAGAHTLQLAIPTADGMQAINVGVTVGGPVPASVPAGEGGLPRGGGLLAMSLALGAAALLTARLSRREATGPTIG